MPGKTDLFHEITLPAGKGEPIVLGMSGGADSGVSARLLRDAGYEVLGVTLAIPGSRKGAGSPSERAAAICSSLGIEHMTLDTGGRFGEKVIGPFVRAYGRGVTPNPCVTCNAELKFPLLASLAQRRGIARIATGHYARLVRKDGRAFLAEAADPSKDQSYFLYRVHVSLLERTVFPLHSSRKVDVLRAAGEMGISAHTGGESQDICFIPEGDTGRFVGERIDARPGEIVDESGAVLGVHDGIHRFTVGQRRGLGVAAGRPMYVSRIEADTGRVVLSDDAALYCSRVVCGRAVTRTRRPSLPLDAKIRYRHPPAKVSRISLSGGSLEVTFDRPQRAPAPGQSLVLYREGLVMGGGTIEEVSR